jgi:hypothetical protein
LLGFLALATSFLGVESPGAVELLQSATPTAAEHAVLAGRVGSSVDRAQVQDAVDARGETALISGAAMLVVEAGVSLFAASGFLVVALAGKEAQGMAWQGAGALALGLASATAGLARVAVRQEGEPLTAVGAALLVPFLICALAMSQHWDIVLAGAPMVLLGIFLVAARPARFPRVVDVVLTLATLGTAVAVAVMAAPVR